MSESGNLIDFEVIENQKENIQSLPGGHSARALASLFSASPLQQLPTPSDTSNANNIRRQEFEFELANISESDDPLDIYDRYVRWTLDAYPSAQATPSSQLLPLLERATKAFLNTAQYKNDPRYLKLWISYIQLVSDAPREVFAFLARHNIGQGLALFYEEFASWLEQAERWKQAEEIYKMGIEKEASPIARLLRKYEEFQVRMSSIPTDTDQPSSPALPIVRPALATKIDPFAPVIPTDPQAPLSNSENRGLSKSGRQKLQIFSDKDNSTPAVLSARDPIGWQSIGSLAERKKENTVDSKPWLGETLKAGGKKSSTKLPVFRDESLSQFTYPQVTNPAQHQLTVNQKGRTERIFVNLEALYPTPHTFGSEMSVEELRAKHRGWLSKVWKPEILYRKNINEDSNLSNESDRPLRKNNASVQPVLTKLTESSSRFDENLILKETVGGGHSRKMKIREINETQIIKAKLSPPTGPRATKRKSKEQTVTLHTKAAIDDIYELFNQPLKPPEDSAKEEGNTDDDLTDGDYTSGGDSTTTGRVICTSEADDDEETSDSRSLNQWTEDTFQKRVQKVDEKDETTTVTHRGIYQDTRNEIEIQRLAQNNKGVISTPCELSSLGETILTSTQAINSEPPTQPYRDPAQASQNRLPFMTPIAEKTESSLGMLTVAKNKIGAVILTNEPLTNYNSIPSPQHASEHAKSTPPTDDLAAIDSTKRDMDLIPKSVIISDAQCNPTDATLRETILCGLDPPLQRYEGFHDYVEILGGKTSEIKKYLKAASKSHKKGSDKTSSSIPTPPTLQFPGTEKKYLLRCELGAGTFAPVYLIESIKTDDTEYDMKNKSPRRTKNGKDPFSDNGPRKLQALKMEHKPSAWEFYIIRQARYRLSGTRAVHSVIDAQEMHIYKDECFLIEDFRSQGTLLDVINISKSDKSGPGVMDEILAMFFTVELFRTVETLHAKSILHGDLKADNCLVRFDPLPETETWDSSYRRDGSSGWAKKGICLIDFGRGIDMKVFNSNVQFIADWESGPQDCSEIREMRPWTYQIDYHGLSGILYSMIFGKYIETVADNRDAIGPGARKTWRLKESLKRYWQTDLWAEAFDLLLNPTSHTDGEDTSKMPLTRGMRNCREKMELWLETNSERGVGLQALIRKIETQLARKK